MYQGLYEMAKTVKRDTCMKFCYVARPLYLETDACGLGLETRLLQVRDGMNCRHDERNDNAILQLNAFTSKNLSSAQ